MPSAVIVDAVRTPGGKRNGKLAGSIAPLANWASDRHNHLTRPLLEKVAGVDRHAALRERQQGFR